MTPELDEASGRYVATIDGIRFEFERWRVKAAMRRLASVAAMIGAPALARGMGQGSAGGIVSAIAQHIESSGDKALDLLELLTATPGGVLADSKPIDFDKFYAGRFDLIIDVAAANVNLQYGSGKKMLEKVDQLTGGKVQAFTSQTTSTTA